MNVESLYCSVPCRTWVSPPRRRERPCSSPTGTSKPPPPTSQLDVDLDLEHMGNELQRRRVQSEGGTAVEREGRYPPLPPGSKAGHRGGDEMGVPPYNHDVARGQRGGEGRGETSPPGWSAGRRAVIGRGGVTLHPPAGGVSRVNRTRRRAAAAAAAAGQMLALCCPPGSQNRVSCPVAK